MAKQQTYVYSIYTTIVFTILLCNSQIGRLQESYTSVKHSLDTYPDHFDSQELLKQLQQHFAAL